MSVFVAKPPKMTEFQFFQLTERNVFEINPVWKAIHLYSLVTIVIFGFVTAHAFDEVLDGFDHKCILYSKISFGSSTKNSPNPEGMNVTTPQMWRQIHHETTKWGQTGLCNFCQFAPVVSSIFAFVWIVFLFFNIFGLPWRTIFPSIVISAIYSIIFLVSSLKLAHGILAFCAQFKEQLNTTRCTRKIDEYTLNFHDVEKSVFIYLRISVWSSFIILAAWVISLVTLVLRVVYVADFELWLVTLKEIKQGELQQSVINFEDEEEAESVLKYNVYEDDEEKVLTIVEPTRGSAIITQFCFTID